MKKNIQIIASLLIIVAALFLVFNMLSQDVIRKSKSLNVNPQAFSTGLIGIDEKALPGTDSRERALYVESCTFCHDLPDPASHDAFEWGFVVERMEELIDELNKQDRTPIPWNDEKAGGILDYLQKNAFKGVNPDNLPDRPEKGAKLFKTVCKECHLLHDPSMHSIEVWKYVVDKMRNFQNEMEMLVITDDEAEEVLKYIDSVSKPGDRRTN